MLDEPSVIYWEFTVEYYDIEFTINFTSRDETILSPKKVESGTLHKVIHEARFLKKHDTYENQGALVAQGAGTYTLCWNNSYSYLKNKVISYRVFAFPLKYLDSMLV